ncbi:hypothetical protein ACTA71_012152 [Dictyostelium dimigraforme]
MDNDRLFFSIWKNVYLRKLILNHVKMYLMNKIPRSFNVYQDIDFQIKNHQNSEYLESIILINSKNNKNDDDNGQPNFEISLKSIKENVETLFVNCSNRLSLIDRGKEPILNEIPKSITRLKFCEQFMINNWDQLFKNVYFTLTSLELGMMPYYIKPNSIPPNLLKLKIGNLQNNSLVGVLPRKLEYLLLGFIGNIGVYDLPSSLSELILYGYRKPFQIDVLPKQLKILNLPNYNQEFEMNVLPPNLKELILGQDYIKEIKDNVLPITLKTLVINNSKWCQPLTPNLLPDSLTYLEILGYQNLPNNLPRKLNYLNLGKSFNQPLGKRGLVGSLFNALTFNYNNNYDSTTIPPNVKSLIMPAFNQRIYANELPTSLTYLEITGFTELFPHCLPKQLKVLIVSNFFNGNKPLKRNCLPCELEHFEMIGPFNQNIEWLPNEKLKTLKLGKCFNKDLPIGLLPNSLKLLEISNLSFNKDIHLPNETTILKLKASTLFYNDLSKLKSKTLNLIKDYESSFSFNNNHLSKFGNNLLPPNVNTVLLILPQSHLSPNEGMFPTSITSLSLCGVSKINFNDGCLKNLINLIYFEIDQYSDYLLSDMLLPSSIKILTVNNNFNQMISSDILPSLSELKISGNGCPIFENNDPTLFKHLHSIFVLVKNINFLDSINQSLFFNYLKLEK